MKFDFSKLAVVAAIAALATGCASPVGAGLAVGAAIQSGYDKQAEAAKVAGAIKDGASTDTLEVSAFQLFPNFDSMRERCSDAVKAKHPSADLKTAQFEFDHNGWVGVSKCTVTVELSK
jgi:hypothetical protein